MTAPLVIWFAKEIQLKLNNLYLYKNILGSYADQDGYDDWFEQ